MKMRAQTSYAAAQERFMEPPTKWDGTERRKSPRLRKIIDELQSGVSENRAAIAALTHQIFSLKEQVEALRRE
jgi:hypothetical protein